MDCVIEWESISLAGYCNKHTNKNKTKCKISWLQLSLLAVGCALAQNYNDGQYYPEVYAAKFDDGKWRPDNSGAYQGRTGVASMKCLM